MKSPRLLDERYSNLGRSISGGHEPISFSQPVTISARRFRQSSAVRTSLPSSNFSNVGYFPNCPTNSGGGRNSAHIVLSGISPPCSANKSVMTEAANMTPSLPSHRRKSPLQQPPPISTGPVCKPNHALRQLPDA